MYRIVLQVDDRLSGVLVCIKFDESETPIGLHADLDDVPVSLEQRDKVGLCGVRDEVSNVDGRVKCARLVGDGLEIERTSLEVGWRGCTSETASGSTGLGFLVGPVDTDRPGAKPFAVHRRDGLLSVRLVPKGEKCGERCALASYKQHVVSNSTPD
jgi:hypothetical protein